MQSSAGAATAAAQYSIAECKEALGGAQGAIAALDSLLELKRRGSPRLVSRVPRCACHAPPEADINQHTLFTRPVAVQSSAGAATAAAQYSIAECKEALGDAQGAIAALDSFLELTRLGSPRMHARACCKLGSLYYSMQRYSEVRLRTV